MSALQTLVNDHRKINDLFEALQRSDDAEKRRLLFQRLKVELDAHTQLEEDVFYPRLAQYEQLAEFLQSHYEGHQEMKEIIEEIEEIEVEADGKDPEQISKLRDQLECALEDLIDVVSYHVEEEEEMLLPQVLSLLSVPELDRLEDALTSEVANRAA